MSRRIRINKAMAAGTLFFVLAGLGLLVFAGQNVLSTRDFLHNAAPVTGEVIDNPVSCDDDGCSYWPRLRIKDPTGETRNTQTRFGSGAYDWDVGETVEVLYHRDYAYVLVPGTVNLYGLGIALGIMGLAFTILGSLGFFLAAVRRE
ncbi:MAG: DUF3592 domain-containing protein [Pseudomonadota bacterium]